jgi:hypothetical protein
MIVWVRKSWGLGMNEDTTEGSTWFLSIKGQTGRFGVRSALDRIPGIPMIGQGLCLIEFNLIVGSVLEPRHCDESSASPMSHRNHMDEIRLAGVGKINSPECWHSGCQRRDGGARARTTLASKAEFFPPLFEGIVLLFREHSEDHSFAFYLVRSIRVTNSSFKNQSSCSVPNHRHPRHA